MGKKNRLPIHHLVEPYGDSVQARIVSAILWDVTDRRGWRQEWDQFDDEIKNQVIAVWLAIVDEILLGSTNGKSAAQWSQNLVDDVATVTQLDPEKDALPNAEDWQRCAERLFGLALAQGRSEGLRELKK